MYDIFIQRMRSQSKSHDELGFIFSGIHSRILGGYWPIGAQIAIESQLAARFYWTRCETVLRQSA
jgi:hypothetical protein